MNKIEIRRVGDALSSLIQTYSVEELNTAHLEGGAVGSEPVIVIRDKHNQTVGIFSTTHFYMRVVG